MKYWKSIKVFYDDNKELWDYVLKNTLPQFYVNSESLDEGLIEIDIDEVKEFIEPYLYTYLYDDKTILDKKIIQLIEFLLELGYETEQVGNEAYFVSTKETKNISDFTLF